MHNFFLVYFVNLYMFRPYLGPSSGGTIVCIQQLVLIILFRLLPVVLVGLELQSNQDNRKSSNSNPNRTKNSHLKRIICTNCCIHTVVHPDDGPRYARNMYRLTKYTKNKLCIKLFFLYTIKFYVFSIDVHNLCLCLEVSSISLEPSAICHINLANAAFFSVLVF